MVHYLIVLYVLILIRLFRDDATKLWRRSDINAKYELCRSYPSSLIVPTAISDNHLKICCQQRSGRRLPVLTWIHPTNGASLCRSSQPYIGMSANACLEDELLLNTIRQCTQYYALDSINRNQDIVLSNTGINERVCMYMYKYMYLLILIYRNM